MTRDEAITMYKKHFKTGSYDGAAIDFLVEAGILKLDDPKTPVQELHVELEKRGFTGGEVLLQHLISRLGYNLTDNK
jgi:hypothetical protein